MYNTCRFVLAFFVRVFAFAVYHSTLLFEKPEKLRREAHKWYRARVFECV